MTKNVLNFKLEYDEKEKVTPRAGLGIYGEMYKALGVDKDVDGALPEPGSGAGFESNVYVQQRVMTFIGGGKYIEDVKYLGADEGLLEACKVKKVSGSDAEGKWLIRKSREKILGLHQVHDNLSIKVIKKSKEEGYTLDIDAMEIVAEKESAELTYKFNKGYMPMLGFIPELDWCIDYDFREGDVPPNAKNYEFAKEVIEKVEEFGRTIVRFRSDSAAYVAELFNYLNLKGIKYTITVDQDVSIKEAISNISESDWKPYITKEGEATDREYVEIIHTMNKGDHPFRVIILRWKNPKAAQPDLFEKVSEYCYHGIATNYDAEEKDSMEVVWWHNGRSNSENYNKEIKNGFNLDYVPSGDFGANAVWFGIGMLAYNLFIASKLFLFPLSWAKKTIRTVRWQFIQMAARVIRRSRRLILRLCSTIRENYAIYTEARLKCAQLQLL